MSVDMLVDINRLSVGQHVSLYVNHVLATMLTKSWLLVLVSMLVDILIDRPPTAHKNIWTKFRPTYQPNIDGVLVNIPANISTDNTHVSQRFLHVSADTMANILFNILSHITTDTQPRVDGVWSTSQLICQPMLCQGVPKLQRSSDLGSTSDWLKEISFAARPIKSTTQWVVRHHQYWICALSTDVILQGKQWRCHKNNVGCFLRLQQIPKIKLHV